MLDCHPASSILTTKKFLSSVNMQKDEELFCCLFNCYVAIIIVHKKYPSICQRHILISSLLHHGCDVNCLLFYHERVTNHPSVSHTLYCVVTIYRPQYIFIVISPPLRVRDMRVVQNLESTIAETQ